MRLLGLGLSLILLVLLFQMLANSQFVGFKEAADNNNQVFFGVSYGGNTVWEAERLIDRIKSYTNFFVVNSWDVSIDEEKLDSICEYAYRAGLSFVVYIYISPRIYVWQSDWLERAQERWTDKFLGIYLYDEPGGKQIDKGQWDHSPVHGGIIIDRFENVTNQAEAADRFITTIANTRNMQLLKNLSINAFTSDYALYWFDYKAGYDVVLAQFGWDHNQVKHIALCRGAAKAQNKQWGVIITWASNDHPYIASSNQIYNDLMLAYDCGAQYIVVFNFPHLSTYGALENEHFFVIEKFWNTIQTSKTQKDSTIAFVLPKDYGWGMRNPDDKIWGLWNPDTESIRIGEHIGSIINEYKTRADILYNDPQFINASTYQKIYFWNGTTIDNTKSLLIILMRVPLIVITTGSLIICALISYKYRKYIIKIFFNF
jgi:hypothetical protein